MGSLPQGRSRIRGRLWQCPGAREEPPPPTPLGPSVIRAIFRPFFLPISGLWTGPESGLSWGRGLEPLNWAVAWELQPQHRPQPGAESWQGEGSGDVARPEAGLSGGVSLAHLTPPRGPSLNCPPHPPGYILLPPSCGPADSRLLALGLSHRGAQSVYNRLLGTYCVPGTDPALYLYEFIYCVQQHYVVSDELSFFYK